MAGLRREERVPLELPVRVWGMDANKKAFLLNVSTRDVTRMGARIVGLNTTVPKGEIIGVQCGELKARFKICWSGDDGTARAGEIGVYSLEPEKYLWGNALTETKKKTGVFTLPVMTAAAASPAAAPAPATGRRLYKRINCSGKVEFRRDGSGHLMWGTLSDISMTGCYVETIDPAPKGAKGVFIIRGEGCEEDIRATGEVRAVHPMVGMGVVFSDMSLEDRTRLQDYCDKLQGLVKELPPAPATPSADAKGPERAVIAVHLADLDSGLRSLEHMLKAKPAELDGRVLPALEFSIRNLRHTICVAQQCIDLQMQKCDPYDALLQLATERVKQASALVQDVANDVDSCELSLDSPGLDQLFVRINKLQARLAKMFRVEPAGV